MFLDDSGWADFRPFGQTPYPTPNVEQLAQEGCAYHQFYVPQAICSASRASLLTGCYPGRHQIYGAIPPRARGLDPSFATIAEVLKPAGYVSGVFGKWHIGDHAETRPPSRGFDESSGLMYSNDMWKQHPQSRNFDKFELQFWRNGEIEIDDVSPDQQRSLTTWYTEHAVDFIERHADEPFFLYVPHNMPHVPLFCSDKFDGKSGHGLYADVMMEIDWSLGEITKALKATGLAEDTIVVFTSDNGPWISYGNHAGSTPYREAKGTGFDGGTRSACVMRAPGEISPGSVSHQAFCSVDLLPTFAGLAGADLPESEIDGVDVWDIIRLKPDAANPHDYYPVSTGRNFDGVVSGDGKWKLHLPHKYRSLAEVGNDGEPGRYENAHIELSLFNLATDPYETTNVIDDHPEIATKLQAFAEAHRDRWWVEKQG
jgi:arylsulfatase A